MANHGNHPQSEVGDLDDWVSAAQQQYRTLRYSGTLQARSPSSRPHLKPVFALAASLAVMALVWTTLDFPRPAAPGSEWNQPGNPTSVRDLSSLTRGLRQGLPGSGDLAPQKPQGLQFRLPRRPRVTRPNGFSQPTETSGTTIRETRGFS